MTWMGRWLDNGLFCNVEKQSIFPLAAFQGNTTVFYHVDLDLGNSLVEFAHKNRSNTTQTL